MMNMVALYCILHVLKDNLMLSTSNVKHFYKSIDLNINDEHGCTQLHIACLKGHSDVVKLHI